MSLNIKNERVHEHVRRLAQMTGTSQTAAVDIAVRRYLEELESDPLGPRGPRIRAALDTLRRAVAAEGILADSDLYDDRAGLPR